MKQEKLDWLADNPFYTKRFAFYIGRRCRSSSIQDVAKEHFSRLENRQDTRDAIHARADQARWYAGAQGHWY